MFTSFHVGHYVPLTWVSFGFDYLVWGMDPFGYHLTNLVLHAANAVLFYLVALRLLALASPALAVERPGLRVAALAAALLFSVHPLRVESVAWATERRDVLCGLFYLLAVLSYLRAADYLRANDARARHRRVWYAATIAAGAAAMLSKSMAVSLPAVLLLLDLYPLKRLTLDRSLLLDAGRRRVLASSAPLFLFAAAAAVLAVLAVGRADALTTVGRMGIVERLSLACFSLAFYPFKMLVPLHLSPLYELPPSIHWWTLPFALSTLVVIGITGLAVGLRRRWPALTAAWVGYVVMLLPVSGIVHNGPQITADRYSYLPCLPWALLAGGGVGAAWLDLRRIRSVSRAAAWTLAPILIVAVGLGILTWRQTYVWHDTGTFWAQALAAAPSAMAHASVATLLADQGRAQDAISHYEDALRINPRSGRIHISLGVELARQGRLAEAIAHDEEAVRLMPDSAVAYNNLGAALAAQGRTEEAIERYRQALRRLPDYAEAHNNLGRSLSDSGHLAEATLHYREALRLRPDLAQAHDGLARALFKQGLMPEALQEFRETVRLRPADAVARYNLGNMLAGLGRPDEAAAQFREALRLDPNLRQAQAALDAALARVKQKY